MLKCGGDKVTVSSSYVEVHDNRIFSTRLIRTTRHECLSPTCRYVHHRAVAPAWRWLVASNPNLWR